MATLAYIFACTHSFDFLNRLTLSRFCSFADDKVKVMKSLVIDGGTLEGGGQLLRNSVSLSALLLKPVSINDIRKNRTPPGLKRQHRTGIELAADICSAKLVGAEIASTSISFTPSKRPTLPKNYSANIGTAGSTSLLLQVALPCLLFASHTSIPSSLSLYGGTNVAQAPQVDYAQHILFPFLQRHFHVNPHLELRTRGYFPRGGGKVVCTVPPVRGPLPAITLMERGRIKYVRGRSHVARLPNYIARAMRDAAVRNLIEGGVDSDAIDILAYREKDTDVVGRGAGITLWAETEGGCILGGSALSSKSLKPEEVGKSAADELLKELNHQGCLDEYLQDQIIIFLALARGLSTIRTGPLSLHTRTAIWVAEHITDAKFQIEEQVGGQTILRCTGIGYEAPHDINVRDSANDSRG